MTLAAKGRSALHVGGLGLVALLLLGSETHARPRSDGSLRKASSGFLFELGKSIAGLVAERISLPEATVTVQRLELPEPGTVPAGTRLTSVELASKGRPMGWVTARARVTSSGGERDLWVKAQVEVLAPTLIAARPLARGLVIGLSDVRIEARPLDEERIATVTPAIGQKLRQALDAGESISLRALERPTLVARGDTVTTVFSGASFAIKAPAEALEDGALGDEIALRVKLGRKVVRGVVIAAGQVELR